MAKKKMALPDLLAQYGPSLPFVLAVHASEYRVGAVIFYLKNEEECSVAFA